MKRLLLLGFFVIAVGCTHYSTAMRTEPENIINAPIDVVWGKALLILPTERITLKVVNKADYFIAGRKHITLWSWGDDISIRLTPKGKKQTVMHFGAGAKAQLFDWGHEGRMVKNIFDRIKNASEGTGLSD